MKHLDMRDIIYIATLHEILGKDKSYVNVTINLKNEILENYNVYLQENNKDNVEEIKSVYEFSQQYIEKKIIRLQDNIDTSIKLELELKRKMWYCKIKYLEAKKNNTRLDFSHLGPKHIPFPKHNCGLGYYTNNIGGYYPGEGSGYYIDDECIYDDDDYND